MDFRPCRKVPNHEKGSKNVGGKRRQENAEGGKGKIVILCIRQRLSAIQKYPIKSPRPYLESVY